MYDRWSFINTSLAQRGISTSLTRFRSEVILLGNQRLDLSCYNSILYLLNTENLPEGTRLFSDENMYEIEEFRNPDNLEEFTGLLTITLPKPADRDLRIDFIQLLKK